MGKKNKWFGAVKKVFSPESKEKKHERSRGETADEGSSATVAAAASTPIPEEMKAPFAAEPGEQVHHGQHAAPPAVASAAEAVAPAAPVALATIAGMPTEEVAAIKIQTAFRGYLARRALRALRGLVRLKSLIQGNSVKRQAASTLRCMQTLSRVQSQIRSRRLKMSEENQALQRQLLLKKELESLRMGEQWDDSLQSKEQIEASLVNRQEAAARRERALAYAFSHQWKNSSRSVNPMFVDPNNPQWGWSWLERWMAAKPWEGRSTSEKEANADQASVKSISQSVGEGEITKAYSRRDSKPDKTSPTAPKLIRPASLLQSPSTPSPKMMPVLSKKKSVTPKDGLDQVEDDARSVLSVKSERPRRHSIGVANATDDESIAGSPAIPSYMAPTESARAKSRLQSPLSNETAETPEKAAVSSAGSIKKRLSFAAATDNKSNAAAAAAASSPAAVRRHSGPPRVEATAAKNVEVQSEA